MESTKLLVSRISGCLEDFENSSDMCLVYVCRKFRLFVAICSYEGDKYVSIGVDTIRFLYRTIRSVLYKKDCNWFQYYIWYLLDTLCKLLYLIRENELSLAANIFLDVEVEVPVYGIRNKGFVASAIHGICERKTILWI